MADLRVTLEEALSSQGRLVMLMGEPGIGKTRTAEELAYIAENRGAQVLWGRSQEEEGAPPFWPWVQTLRSCIRQKDRQQLASEMAPGAANIAELVSEVRVKLPTLVTRWREDRSKGRESPAIRSRKCSSMPTPPS